MSWTQDLSEQESIDLWLSVRKVSDVIEKEYGASALNVAIQDGKDAGQSVPHVHFHILPRSETVFSFQHVLVLMLLSCL